MSRRRMMMGGGIASAEEDIFANYLTVRALVDDFDLFFSGGDLEYCIHSEGVWKPLPNQILTPSISQGDAISFRANLIPTTSGIGVFTVNGMFALEGNCMSILYGDDAAYYTSVPSYAFYRLFGGCWYLTSVAPSFLPATTLSESCYRNMFVDCQSLETAPVLPSTVMASNCYRGMFSGCFSLVNAPVLPATTLATYCYAWMFENCSSLVDAPALPATTLATYCYNYMFYGCTKLSMAPALPALSLKERCYNFMFYGCSKLSYVKAMFTSYPGTTYTGQWLYGVSDNGTFVKNSLALWNVYGSSGIPATWTVETANN